MGKKKEKQQVINNIQNMNLEIDYDKLAESIVKAQEKSEENKQERKEYTAGTFAILLMFAFRILAVVGGCLAICVPIAVCQIWDTLNWNSVVQSIFNGIVILFLIGFTVIVALYSILLWKSASEIETEKDRNYIVAVFSGVVSFAALIVALVALIKG